MYQPLAQTFKISPDASAITVTGTASPLALANLILSQQFNEMPFVVTPDIQTAHQMKAALLFLDSKIDVEVFSSLETTPYSGILPRERSSAERCGFLTKMLNSKNTLFISSVVAAQQKTIPVLKLSNHIINLVKGFELTDSIFQNLLRAGYRMVDTVESPGDLSVRGSIVDIFSPAESYPARIDRFGDEIERMRYFNPAGQRSLNDISSYLVSPSHEFLFSEIDKQSLLQKIDQDFLDLKKSNTEKDNIIHAILKEHSFPGISFLLPYAYPELSSVFDYLGKRTVFVLDTIETQRQLEIKIGSLIDARKNSRTSYVSYEPSHYYLTKLPLTNHRHIVLQKISFNNEKVDYLYPATPIIELANKFSEHRFGTESWIKIFSDLIAKFTEDDQVILICCRGVSNKQRLEALLENLELSWINSTAPTPGEALIQARELNKDIVLIEGSAESINLKQDKVVVLKDSDLMGKSSSAVKVSASEKFQREAERLSFGELRAGDYVVHSEHGIGTYDGMKIMDITGVNGEFLQISYKDGDKLYLPVYRLSSLRRFAGPQVDQVLDKLGGNGWAKTKGKVKKHLKDITSELLNLYAQRAQAKRPLIGGRDSTFQDFENSFPYEETEDQMKAIDDILADFSRPTPMDRLVCGDVGFGKTEIAMRAAFRVTQNKLQVALIAPTTVLTFQHFESLKKRFEGWPIKIEVLNRFVPPAQQKRIIQETKSGLVDILIGTHRIFSNDVSWSKLGLLIIDEEQRFGVQHKEKIRQLKVNVDTLALSATPIPRTLNLSLMGVRDLSLITTPPVDRLPIRTLICQFDEQTIASAIRAEIQRGGQIYFIHNRVQSIYGLADRLRALVPEARSQVAHGQMPEHELEKAMLKFFNHEIDMLICTTIVESGMDVSRANTMFIDQAQIFGLSQLYQLRGRVGRSKEKAFCYLLLPDRQVLDKDAQERLRVIQENTELGSGIRIAHYDLELRGSGSILGQDQSGHINAIGYEMYMDLLQQTLAEAKGETDESDWVEPDIQLKIPALIPESYVRDIKSRLYFYKLLNDARQTEDFDKIEDELRDLYGAPPVEVMNLFGVMLIKCTARHLKITDLSAGPKMIAIKFHEKTPLTPDIVIGLATRQSDKYSITPDSRLRVRVQNTAHWPDIYTEISHLDALVL